MTIACRTGCGEQIENEFNSFSDGFVYLLPLNENGTIHNCKNLIQFGTGWSKEEEEALEKLDVLFNDNIELESLKNKIFVKDNWKKNYNTKKLKAQVTSDFENYVEKISKKNIPQKYLKSSKNSLREEYFGMMLKGTKLDRKLDKQTSSILLRNVQMRCILFPTPFLTDPTNLGGSDIIFLSGLYTTLGDFESAIRARLIQDRITHDQSQFILELYKKQKEFNDDVDDTILIENIPAVELRNTYYRKVENLIKSFIRKTYHPISHLKEDYPDEFKTAESLRSNPSDYVQRSNDDVIEYLTFGQCVKIIKINKINNNKKQEKDEWNCIDWNIIQRLDFIKDRRNDTDHVSDEDLENRVTQEAKIVGHLFSKKIIDFFKNLKLK